jgi:hypothetical protein
VFVSAEIIQLMPRPGHDSEQTDFPAIAFRSSIPAIARDLHVRPHDIELTPGVLNNGDRTSSNE